MLPNKEIEEVAAGATGGAVFSTGLLLPNMEENGAAMADAIDDAGSEGLFGKPKETEAFKHVILYKNIKKLP